MSDDTNTIRETILRQTRERGDQKAICPSEVAREIAGPDETKWRLLMKPIRAEAVQLAKEAEIEIVRKKKVVDPENFKGVYRLKQPEA